MIASEPSVTPSRFSQTSVHAIAAVLAVLAGVRHALLMTSATNDNFLHMTLAQQLLAGDWPVRDFFDGGWVLQYTLSAAAQLVLGNRLLAEAMIVGLAWACSTYIVVRLVRGVSGSTVAAVLAGTLPLMAGARGYSYPKGIVYAVAAALWWSYVSNPTTARAVGFGAWVAAAFFWRPDHGLYVAIGFTLAAWVAHGFSRAWISSCAVAGGTTLALVAPFLIYVHLTFGLPEHVVTGLAAAQVEHTTQGPHAWPLLRFSESLVTIEPREQYAPVITIRWSGESSPDARRRILESYGLTPVEADGEAIERVRVAEGSIPKLRALMNESVVEDTGGIDRSTGMLLPASWPDSQRSRFYRPWLRFRVLPDLEGQARISEFVVAVLYLLPILMAAAAPSMARQSGGRWRPRAFVAFAAFAFLVDLAMLRLPFTARMFDAVVLPAIVFGWCLAWLWRAASQGASRTVLRTTALVLALVVVTTVGRAGQFGEPIAFFAAPLTRGDGRAPLAALHELTSSPPLAYYVDRPARFTLRLAAYARECVPPSDRLLVLWFEPEIYYYSERLMAQRHLVFAPAWATLEHEQRTTLEKIMRFAPPLVLARRSALDEYARATYPGVIDYVEREYQLAATVADDGEEYLIFTRRGRPALRGFGSASWPCFVGERTPWSRVGQPGD